MKCTIPAACVKVIGRAIHSLAKIGEEIYFEPLEDGLSLRTVNSSRSAYACFTFESSFFSFYENSLVKHATSDDDDILRCKVKAKTCVSIFRSISVLEKSVEKCKIKLDTDECRLVIQLCCRHGIVKTHNLAFIECESLQAVFSKGSMFNNIQTHAKLFGDTVSNFQFTQEEVTLIVDNEKVCFKNYVQEEKDPQKVIHTSLCLDPEEFVIYAVKQPSEVTFCLKEFRAILSFCEPLQLLLSINFESAGKPIIFSVSSDSTFEVNYVLATLSESSTESIPSLSSQSINNSTRYQDCNATANNRKSKTVSQSVGSNSMKKNNSNQVDDDEVNISHDQLSLDIQGGCKQKYDSGKSCVAKTMSQSVRSNSVKTNIPNQADEVLISHDQLSLDIQDVCKQKYDSVIDRHTPKESSSQANFPSKNSKESHKEPHLFISSSDEDADGVPGTPPPKRTRALFSGWSQASTSISQSNKAKHKAVLVEDTDEDE